MSGVGQGAFFSSSAICARTNCTIAGMSMAAPRKITPDAPRGGQTTGGLLQDHHLGRLHDRADIVSDGEPEVLRGGARDHGDDLLRTAALGALTGAEGPEEFEAAWKTVADNFGLVADAPEAAEELRDVVRELAVQGRLTGAAPGEDGLPGGWRWATPDDVCARERHALAIGPFGSSLLKADYTDAGVPLVFVREITSGSFGGPRTRFVTGENGSRSPVGGPARRVEKSLGRLRGFVTRMT